VRRHFATRPENFVGNGSLTLETWQFKRRMRLVRHDRYWGADRVKIETVDVLPVSDANTRVLGYETGSWDVTTDPPPQVARRLTAQTAAGERRDFYNQNLLATYFYRCNCNRFPTDDANVRRALALAIDRDAICARVLGGGQVAARAFVPYTATPYLSKRDDAGNRVSYEPPDALRFDPAAARQALIDAGWTYADPGGLPTRDGEPFPVISITYNTDSRHELIAQAVARMWAEHLGIRVELRNLELQAFYERERKSDFDVTRGSWFADYLDPGAMLSIFTTHSGHNRTGWASPAYDALIAAAELELDPAKRYMLFGDAESLLVEYEMPIIPIFYYTGSMLISDRVAGITPNVRNIPFLHAARIREEGAP
jgi:oligopeptide transport system substrate-binding protein